MPEEANSERGLELLTNGGGSKGFTNAVRGALLHHIPMWGLLILAGLGLLGGLFVGWYAGNSDLAAKRWKARSQAIASDSYLEGVTPHPIPEHPGKLSQDWTNPKSLSIQWRLRAHLVCTRRCVIWQSVAKLARLISWRTIRCRSRTRGQSC